VKENEMNYNEMIEKYGKEKVKFSSYYKFTFYYSNENLAIACGGNSENIYRDSVVAGREYTVRELGPYLVEVDGEEVFYEPF
jgi:hypothetical protein